MLAEKNTSTSTVSRFTKETRVKLAITFISLLVMLFASVILIAVYQSSRTGEIFSLIVIDWFKDPSTYIALIPAALFLTTMLVKVNVSIPLPVAMSNDNVIDLIQDKGYTMENTLDNHITFKPTSENRITNNAKKFNFERKGGNIIISGPLLFTVRLSRWIETQLSNS